MILERVMAYCIKYDLSIAAFERKCNIGNGAVSRWKTKQPSIESLHKVERATGIPLSEWVKGEQYDGDKIGYFKEK